MSSGYMQAHVVTVCIPTQEQKEVEKYFSKVKMPSQLHIGPFLCCYGISLCNPDYDYESILDKLLILTYKILKPKPISKPMEVAKFMALSRSLEASKHQNIIQCLIEKFSNIEVSYVIVEMGCSDGWVQII